MTEGTYPHGFGGVSVWCDQLIRGMPGYDFHLVAIVATEAEQVVWTLPGNVTSMVRVLLWGPPVPSPRPGHRDALPSRLLRQLIDVLLDPSAQAQPRFADLLHELFDFAQHRNLSTGLASDKAVRLLSAAWRERWPDAVQPPPSLHDAVTAMQLLDHSLRPLSLSTAQADIGARGDQRPGRTPRPGGEVAVRDADASSPSTASTCASSTCRTAMARTGGR